nr:uncharacterized protein LOC116777902 isoform X1 [Danaus plexippus plexippus]
MFNLKNKESRSQFNVHINGIKKVAYMGMCLVATLSASRDDSVPEFIEHVLRIPNPDKILNSVVSRLQAKQEGLRERPRYDDADCDTEDKLPEYTESIKETKERELRHYIGTQKHYPICNLERVIIRLNTNEYEYRPAYYEEVRCNTISRDNAGNYNEICSSLGFSCVQWNKTIHLTRRRYSSDCWETKTMVIPAGCECMWPINKLGDIAAHV